MVYFLCEKKQRIIFVSKDRYNFMYDLNNLIKTLNLNNDVDAVFLTGSHADGTDKPYSDIDLIIVLNENTAHLESVFTYINGTFADIFIFDQSDLQKMSDGSRDSLYSVFMSWLKYSDIKFDKSGKTTKLKKITDIKSVNKKEDNSKQNVLQKINYNYICNLRYFDSEDSIYHEALQVRLLYSLIGLITGYFTLRDMQWKGEKNAVKYLKENDSDFYTKWQQYFKTTELSSKVKLYKSLVKLTLPDADMLWDTNLTYLKGKNGERNTVKLKNYWKKLIG